MEKYNEKVNKSLTCDGLDAIEDCLEGVIAHRDLGFGTEDIEYYREVIQSAKNYLMED